MPGGLPMRPRLFPRIRGRSDVDEDDSGQRQEEPDLQVVAGDVRGGCSARYLSAGRTPPLRESQANG